MRASVLVVDDEPDMIEILVGFLAGHRVIAAGDVPSARQILRAERCDLVITDVRLPGESGLDLVAELAASDPSLPVVVISGWTPPEPPPVAAWIAKPFKKAEILAAVNAALEARDTS